VSRDKGVAYIYIGGGGVGFSIGPVCQADMNEVHQLRRHGSGRTSVIGDMDSQVLNMPSVDI
jgi:hypothetical protein